MLTYSQRASMARAGAATLNGVVAEAVKAVAEQEEAQRQANIAAWDRHHAPVPYTAEELAAARFIRTLMGWHRVVKVNAKTVSVETGHTWNDRHPIDKILEVRS